MSRNSKTQAAMHIVDKILKAADRPLSRADIIHEIESRYPEYQVGSGITDMQVYHAVNALLADHPNRFVRVNEQQKETSYANRTKRKVPHYVMLAVADDENMLQARVSLLVSTALPTLEQSLAHIKKVEAELNQVIETLTLLGKEVRP